MAEEKRRAFDATPGNEILTEARRMASANVAPGSMFPYASQPLEWSHAQALALVDIATSLRDISRSLADIDRRLGYLR